ncbi:hypothetical protein HWV62_12394 [Athelia sp. TMB]|nr:hypothetical protein HWV62_12394 [Athelia sp. TMB]
MCLVLELWCVSLLPATSTYSIKTAGVLTVLISPPPAVPYWYLITARLTTMSVDYDFLASQRFKKTELHGYDQITAVSQYAINRQIQLMHSDSAPNSPLRQFTSNTTQGDNYTRVIHLLCYKAVLTQQHSQIVNAQLDPSTVELLLKTDEKQTVLFTMKIKSGTFNYWSGPRGAPVKSTATIENWRVVSKVRLNLLDLDPEKVPQFIRDTLTNPNDYSVHQLLVDFTTADISTYDKTLSEVITDNLAKEEFHTHIKLYWDELKTKDNGSHSTIHYLPTLKKPDTYLAPTIMPTSLNFQNFPFILSSTTTEGQPNNDNNIVIDDDSSKSPAPYRLDGGHFGPPGYEKATGTPWKYDAAKSNDTVFKYTYTREDVFTTKGNDSIKFAQQKVNVWNHLEIPVGLNANGESVMKLSGKTEVWSWITVPAWTIDGFDWTAELVLRTEAHGTENGKLKIEIRNVKAVVGEPQNGYSWASDDVIQQLKGVLEGVQSHIRRQETDLSDTMTNLKGDVDKLFGSSWQFIFGGNDDFYIDKAGFNSEGDLLAQLVYQLKD